MVVVMVGIVGGCDNGDDDYNCDGGGVDSFGNDYAGEVAKERKCFLQRQTYHWPCLPF